MGSDAVYTMAGENTRELGAAVGGNPLADFNVTINNVRWVMKGGRLSSTKPAAQNNRSSRFRARPVGRKIRIKAIRRPNPIS